MRDSASILHCQVGTQLLDSKNDISTLTLHKFLQNVFISKYICKYVTAFSKSISLILNSTILKYLKLSNRISATIGLVLSIVSLILLAHWQSNPYDPCTEFSLYLHPELMDMYRHEQHNISTSLHEFSPDYKHLHDQGLVSRNTSISVLLQELPVVENVIDLAASKCESLHTSTGCHWILTSSVARQNCTDCQLICRSEYRTVNFIQFCIGAVLLPIAHPTISVSMTNLITDVTHKQLHIR